MDTEISMLMMTETRRKGAFPHVFFLIFQTYPGCLIFLGGRASYLSTGGLFT